jgi:hypothetical protein
MAEVGLGRGASSLSRRGHRSWGLRRLRRWGRRVVALLPLCAALVAIGVAIASIGQTRIRSDAPPSAEPTSAAREGGRDGDVVRRETPAEAAPRDVALITEGVSLQVLNATRFRRADDRMAKRLERLGFRVAALNPAARRYGRTTVFWSRPEGRRAAEALAARFGWRAEHKPANLSPSVTAHVVVGRDWASR